MKYTINLFLEQQHTTEIVVGAHLSEVKEGARCAIVFDAFLQKKITTFVQHSTLLIPLSGGEEVKSFTIYEEVIGTLMAQGCAGDTHLIACGGGTILDLAGFVAATYCRGIPLYLIPTTLLSMVDGAIGGKNGINVNGIKNIVGTTYHPKKVLVDLDFLGTLSEYEMACGAAEMIKHALLAGEEAFSFLEKNLSLLLQKDPDVMLEAVRESIAIKCAIVQESTGNPEKRHLLNLGHTIAHAIEALENFQVPHGHAVAIGLIAESFLAMRMGLLSQHDFERIVHVVQALPLSFTLSKRYEYDEWKKVFTLDKKTVLGQPRFVLLQGPGKYVVENNKYCHTVPESRVHEMIDYVMCFDPS